MGNIETVIDILNKNQDTFIGMNECNLHSAHDISEWLKELQSANMERIRELESLLQLSEAKVKLNYQDAKNLEEKINQLQKQLQSSEDYSRLQGRELRKLKYNQ